MKTPAVLGALLIAAALPLFSQTGTVTLKIRAVMVDGDLNQKPVPRLSLILTRSDDASSQPITAKTSFEGTAELQLAPGNYRLDTPDGIEFQRKKYSWEMNIAVSLSGASVDLSNDNAKVTGTTQQTPARWTTFLRFSRNMKTAW
jgi:hypothetical protein